MKNKQCKNTHPSVNQILTKIVAISPRMSLNIYTYTTQFYLILSFVLMGDQSI